MNATTTFQAVAKELADAFETRKRDDGTEFVTIKDDAAEWVRREPSGCDTVAMRVHRSLDERFPDDWVYASMARIADALAGYDDPTDAAGDIADGLVDVYTADLTAWLASHHWNLAFCDEATEEYGPADTIENAIRRGQFLALSRIAGAVIEEIETEAGNREEV